MLSVPNGRSGSHKANSFGAVKAVHGRHSVNLLLIDNNGWTKQLAGELVIMLANWL